MIVEVKVSKDKLDGYRLSLLLIHDTYTNNDEIISKKVDEFILNLDDESININIVCSKEKRY